MCLGIPGRVITVDRNEELLMGKVAFGGIARSVCLAHVPDVEPGDYVLVHVGFALSRIDAREAEATLAMLAELGALEQELGER